MMIVQPERAALELNSHTLSGRWWSSSKTQPNTTQKPAFSLNRIQRGEISFDNYRSSISVQPKGIVVLVGWYPVGRRSAIIQSKDVLHATVQLEGVLQLSFSFSFLKAFYNSFASFCGGALLRRLPLFAVALFTAVVVWCQRSNAKGPMLHQQPL